MVHVAASGGQQMSPHVQLVSAGVAGLEARSEGGTLLNCHLMPRQMLASYSSHWRRTHCCKGNTASEHKRRPFVQLDHQQTLAYC